MSTGFVALLLSWLALALAALALVNAYRAGRAPLTAAKRLEALHADLSAQYAELVESHKRLRSRIGMRELRERRAAEPEIESPADYKARLRARVGLVPGRPPPKVTSQ